MSAHTDTPQFMTAGACFFGPQEGALRIVCGTIYPYLPNNPRANDMGEVATPGLLVQQYVPLESDDGDELCGGGCKWKTVCPLVDFPDMYPGAMRDLPSARAALASAGAA